ncbi:MAG: hypothetical protein KJO55_04110, partial [Gammaproteobacteria bacterium]|nr:hypothetical protein [Gammaproteobacteria bacterium]
MLTGLLKRRVPQILGLYLGAAWVIVEFISFLTERYLLSPALTDFVLVSLLTMLPTVALIAWFHGTPGKDTWAPTEKVLIPINIIIAAGVLFALFGGEELGATTTTVTATDEQGATVTRVVPKPQYRESIALFSFSNDGRTLNWLRYGIPIALSRDLQQNPYIAAWSPLDGYEQNRLLDLQRAGYGDALDVPVPLMRNIASKNNLAYMLTGNFSSGLRGGLRLEAFLYRTDSGAAPKRFDIFGADPGDVVDRLSSEIRRYLDIYSGGDTLGTDLPVAEHFSTSNAAIERYVDAVVLSAIENDSLGAIDVLGEVAEIDPSFAAAAVHRAVLAANNGQTEAAREALALATQHNYRLLPDETFLVKALTYYTRGDVAKMLSVYEMHAELYPGDIHALSRLAYSYIYHANDIDRALATFQQIYELDNSLDWVVSQIASLQRVQG